MTTFFHPTPVEIAEADGQLLVRLTGEVDVAATDALDDAVHHVAEHPGMPVVVDLGEATFIDCAVLRMLAQIADVTAPHSTRVRVTGASPRTRHVLELGGVLHAVELVGGGTYGHRPSHR